MADSVKDKDDQLAQLKLAVIGAKRVFDKAKADWDAERGQYQSRIMDLTVQNLDMAKHCKSLDEQLTQATAVATEMSDAIDQLASSRSSLTDQVIRHLAEYMALMDQALGLAHMGHNLLGKGRDNVGKDAYDLALGIAMLGSMIEDLEDKECDCQDCPDRDICPR